jgi:Uri superfamily endonuclease
MMQLSPEPGTYILILSLPKSRSLAIGKMGVLNFVRGWYAYVGSAMGPGGVAARVNRHLKIDKNAHWHIDYLRPFAQVVGAVVASGKQVREHQWASHLTRPPYTGRPIQGFGSTDCNCQAHLFRLVQPFNPHGLAHFLKAQWLQEP